MEQLLTLATIPAILALVQLGKQMGWIVGKWAALVAVILGILFSLLDYGFNTPLSQLTPSGWWQVFIAGVILGLSAAGIYDAAAIVGVKQAEATAKQWENYTGQVIPGQVLTAEAEEVPDEPLVETLPADDPPPHQRTEG